MLQIQSTKCIYYIRYIADKCKIHLSGSMYLCPLSSSRMTVSVSATSSRPSCPYTAWLNTEP